MGECIQSFPLEASDEMFGYNRQLLKPRFLFCKMRKRRIF